jgi:hypothetical protein
MLHRSDDGDGDDGVEEEEEEVPSTLVASTPSITPLSLSLSLLLDLGKQRPQRENKASPIHRLQIREVLFKTTVAYHKSDRNLFCPSTLSLSQIAQTFFHKKARETQLQIFGHLPPSTVSP